jgi:hypothetical protein
MYHVAFPSVYVPDTVCRPPPPPRKVAFARIDNQQEIFLDLVRRDRSETRGGTRGGTYKYTHYIIYIARLAPWIGSISLLFVPYLYLGDVHHRIFGHELRRVNLKSGGEKECSCRAVKP